MAELLLRLSSEFFPVTCLIVLFSLVSEGLTTQITLRGYRCSSCWAEARAAGSFFSDYLSNSEIVNAM